MEIVGRAALSLQFTDEKLYTELIAPLKANKRLTPLILQLLELYFYNEEFHNLAEQLSPNEEESIADNYDDYFKDISAFIAVMGNMEDTLEENVKQGLQSIIDTAESREDIDSDIWGKPIPRVASKIENIKEIEEKTTSDDSPRIKELEDNVSKLSNTVEELMSVIKQQNTMQMQQFYGMQAQYMQQMMPNPYQQSMNQSNVAVNPVQNVQTSTVAQESVTIGVEETSAENNIRELEKILNGETSRNDETIVNTENETKDDLDVNNDFTVSFGDDVNSDEEPTVQINLTPAIEEEKVEDKEKAKKSLNKLLKSL